MTSLRARYLLVLSLTLAAGCAPADDPDDDAGASGDAFSDGTCAGDDALFFHGLSGFGREIATRGLCVPRIANGGFWGSVAFARAENATVVGGFSAGRLPLVRRLARGEGRESVAVLLDPSYADGPRFEGRTGPAIVDAWLAGDAGRKFVLVYSPSSAGWSEYAALTDGPNGGRVRVCSVAGAHADLPRKVGAELFLDPDAWVETRCKR